MSNNITVLNLLKSIQIEMLCINNNTCERLKDIGLKYVEVMDNDSIALLNKLTAHKINAERAIIDVDSSSKTYKQDIEKAKIIQQQEEAKLWETVNSITETINNMCSK